jgi:hypothetical protein
MKPPSSVTILEICANAASKLSTSKSSWPSRMILRFDASAAGGPG